MQDTFFLETFGVGKYGDFLLEGVRFNFGGVDDGRFLGEGSGVYASELAG